MKSNEDYLDELLKSMNSDNGDNSAINRLNADENQTDTNETSIEENESMLEALLGAEETVDTASETETDNLLEALLGAEETVDTASETEIEALLGAEEVSDMSSKMETDDVLEALLGKVDGIETSSEAGGTTPIESEVQVNSGTDMGKMDQAMIDALLAGTQTAPEPEPEVVAELEALFANGENGEAQMVAPKSALEQLMAEMEAEADNTVEADDTDNDLMSELEIEELLKSAQSTEGDFYEDEVISFDMSNEKDMAEIEALLDMSESDSIPDENDELLKLLTSAENEPVALEMDSLDEIDFEQVERDIELAFSEGTNSRESSSEVEKDKNQKKNKKDKSEKSKKKEKKEGGKKGGFLSKLFSLLMEEVPDEDEDKGTEEINLSEENKKILEQLDEEEEQKIKVKEKKEKNEKSKKDKKDKKEKKPKKEKKVKKEKKPKKEKKVKEKEPYIPEKKIPKKKVIVTYVFAGSILALILLVETLVPSMITLGSARSAFDKGEYYEAYKGFYGQKLSEEDEVKFQAATVIMRMQSNLDGYYNYMEMNDEIMAIHSLLEGVHIKFEAMIKAEEFGVLSQVSAVYDKILEILNKDYRITEEEALELIEEKSDAVYTRKLEAIAEGREYTGGNITLNKEDMLPEEEEIFANE